MPADSCPGPEVVGRAGTSPRPRFADAGPRSGPAGVAVLRQAVACTGRRCDGGRHVARPEETPWPTSTATPTGRRTLPRPAHAATQPGGEPDPATIAPTDNATPAGVRRPQRRRFSGGPAAAGTPAARRRATDRRPTDPPGSWTRPRPRGRRTGTTTHDRGSCFAGTPTGASRSAPAGNAAAGRSLPVVAGGPRRPGEPAPCPVADRAGTRHACVHTARIRLPRRLWPRGLDQGRAPCIAGTTRRRAGTAGWCAHRRRGPSRGAALRPGNPVRAGTSSNSSGRSTRGATVARGATSDSGPQPRRAGRQTAAPPSVPPRSTGPIRTFASGPASARRRPSSRHATSNATVSSRRPLDRVGEPEPGQHPTPHTGHSAPSGSWARGSAHRRDTWGRRRGGAVLTRC